jgi:hypothetical protein
MPLLNAGRITTIFLMKFAATILILNIFVLLSVPCEDSFAAEKVSPANVNAEQTIDGHQHDLPTEEDCSPFCICSCRQVPAAFDHFTVSASAKVFDSKKNIPPFEYKDPLTNNFPTAIWQPPKV